MNKIYFVTGNKNKAKDAQEILGFPIEVVSLVLTEIQDMDLENIVKHKLQEAFKVVQKPLIVEDVGFYVDAWDGFPGPFIKFIEVGMGYHKMLKTLENEQNRKASARIVVGFHDGKNIHLFHGEMKGEIPRKPASGGWGFAVILTVDGKGMTYAELSRKEQLRVSHRGKALRKFKKYLKEKKLI